MIRSTRSRCSSRTLAQRYATPAPAGQRGRRGVCRAPFGYLSSMTVDPGRPRRPQLRDLAAASGASHRVAFLVVVEVALGVLAAAGLVGAAVCVHLGGSRLAIAVVVGGIDVASVLPLLVGA